jgi:hypothetical protein
MIDEDDHENQMLLGKLRAVLGRLNQDRNKLAHGDGSQEVTVWSVWWTCMTLCKLNGACFFAPSV